MQQQPPTQPPTFDPLELVGPAALALLIAVCLATAAVMVYLTAKDGGATDAETAPAAEATPQAIVFEPGAPLSPEQLAVAIETGRELARNFGCAGCHSTDGSILTGPTWKGLFGSQVTLSDGSTVTADEAYIFESIMDPPAKVVEGFQPAMPYFPDMTRENVRALTEWIRSLK